MEATATAPTRTRHRSTPERPRNGIPSTMPWVRACGMATHRVVCWSRSASRRLLLWSGVVGATSRRVSRLVKLEVARWVRRRSPTEPRRRGTVGVVPAVLSLALVYSLWNIAVVTSRLFYDAAASAVPVGRRSVTENGDRVMPRSIYINGYPDPQPLRDPEGTILVSKHVLREWRRIEDDDSYAFVYEKEVPMPDECAPVATWENHSRPNCNAIHELDLPAITLTGELYYVASGGSNDVFRVNNPQDRDVVLKKFSPGRRHHAGIPHTKEYFNFHFDIVRRDAMVMERLTESNHVLSLHGHCGFAVLVPWADGGTFGSALETVNSEGDRGWRDMSSAKRLKYAVDAAKGLADVHDIDVVHGDLTVNQYLVMSGTLQLGDFNRGILLRKNVTDRNDSFCRFAELQQFATMSAPEVYKNEPKTSAIDVWSLGSVLYHILTGRRVWSDKKAGRARDAIVRGELPHISSSILNSPDPVDKILKDALDMCYIYDPSLRATAKEVTAFLDNSHKELN